MSDFECTFGKKILDALECKCLDREKFFNKLCTFEFFSGKEYLSGNDFFEALLANNIDFTPYDVMIMCHELKISAFESFKLVFFDKNGLRLTAVNNTREKRDLACALAMRWNNLNMQEITSISNILSSGVPERIVE